MAKSRSVERTRPSVRRASMTDGVIRQALAILERPMTVATQIPPCRCHGCVHARARSFQCRWCGYHGVPFVYPCECGQMKPDAVTTLAEELRRCEGLGWEDEAARYRRHLADILTDGPKPCGIDGEPQECSHTDAACPVCMVSDDGRIDWTDDPANAHHAWKLIRAVRRLLENPREG